jgi:DoxX-like protein
MVRTIVYWVSTVVVAALAAFAGFSYLMAQPEAVQGFAHVGYPQQLRIMLGIAKPAGAIALMIPGLPILKEWAYAGLTFAWIAAVVAHYRAGDGPTAFVPLALLVVLGISYATRPESRRSRTKAIV